MSSYEYRPLDISSEEIRLLTLLPGQFNEALRVKITHHPFAIPKVNLRGNRRVHTKEHRESLPSGWAAFVTSDGRFLYEYTDPSDGSERTQYTHPDPNYGKENVSDKQHLESIVRPRYEALSYIWGSEPDHQVIFAKIVGDGQSTLQLRHNLGTALQHLRYIDRERVFWVDAACIDQNNPTERAAQVTRMSAIYTLAERVAIWLGPQSHDSALAISTLDYLGSQVEYSRDPRGFLRGPGSFHSNWHVPSFPLPYGDLEWDAIHNLLSRSWFDRLWVIQEARLANSKSILKCGTDEITWDHFRRAILIFNGKEKNLGFDLQDRLDNVYHRICGDNTTMSNILNSIESTKCQDPLDRIYGILAIAPDNIASRIQPSYEIAAPELYRRLFEEHTTLIGRLELLHWCEIDKQIVGSPTWSPNWDAAHRNLSGYRKDIGEMPVGVSHAMAEFEHPNILNVPGVLFATVESIHQSAIDTLRDMDQFLENIGLEKLMTDTYTTGELLIDAYLTTLFLNQLKSPRADWKRWYPSLMDLRNGFLERAKQKSGGTEAESEQLQSMQYANFMRNYRDRRIIWVSGGYIGVGLDTAQPGDIVCTMLGCSTPMLLRPVENDTFKVVSQCWVHGLMDGESLLGPLPAPWQIRMPDWTWGNHHEPEPCYWNEDTKKLSREDPRLGDLPEEWERINVEKKYGDPLLFAPHKNRVTGEVINSDPRLLPEALAARGVKLRTFRLV